MGLANTADNGNSKILLRKKKDGMESSRNTIYRLKANVCTQMYTLWGVYQVITVCKEKNKKLVKVPNTH